MHDRCDALSKEYTILPVQVCMIGVLYAVEELHCFTSTGVHDRCDVLLKNYIVLPVQVCMIGVCVLSKNYTVSPAQVCMIGVCAVKELHCFTCSGVHDRCAVCCRRITQFYLLRCA